MGNLDRINHLILTLPPFKLLFRSFVDGSNIVFTKPILTHQLVNSSDFIPDCNFNIQFRRHRGGKVKNKLRNSEKRKKREQFLNNFNNTLTKLSLDLQNNKGH